MPIPYRTTMHSFSVQLQEILDQQLHGKYFCNIKTNDTSTFFSQTLFRICSYEKLMNIFVILNEFSLQQKHAKLNLEFQPVTYTRRWITASLFLVIPISLFIPFLYIICLFQLLLFLIISVIYTGTVIYLCVCVFMYVCNEAHHPDYGGNRHLWHVSQYLPDYVAQFPRKLLWETEISPKMCVISIAHYTRNCHLLHPCAHCILGRCLAHLSLILAR